MRKILIQLLAALALCAVSAAAAEPPAAIGATQKAADATHGFLSARVEELARHLDSLLGGDRALEESTGTYILVRPGFSKVGADDERFLLDTKAQIVLPYTQEKLKLEIDTRQLADKVSGQEDAEQKPAPGETVSPGGGKGGERLFMGLLADVVREEHWRLVAGTGVQVDFPPDPYAKLVLGYARLIGDDWKMELEEGGFWYLGEGVLARTEAAFTRKLWGDKAITSDSVALWRRDDDSWELAQTVTLLQPIDADTALAWRVGETWRAAPCLVDTEYFTDVTARRRLYKDWLFTEVRPGFTWPRGRGFSPTPGVWLWLEVFFGEK